MKRNALVALLAISLSGVGAAQTPVVGPSINVNTVSVPSRAHKMKSDARNVRDQSNERNKSQTSPSSTGSKPTPQATTGGSSVPTAPDIHRSAADGRADSVKESVEKEPAIVRQTDSSGFTALHYAATGGHTDVLTVLLDGGADVNARGSRGETPLLLAASKGNVGVVELLIERGADVDQPGSDQRTPLHKAAMVGDIAIVRALLAGGANPAPTDRSGKTPADLAEHYRAGDYTKVSQELRKR